MASLGKIGVVTVTYNSAPVLDGFLKSCREQSYSDYILYAVDNASKDTTLDQLRAAADLPIHIVANEQNLGVAEGNNQGTQLALAAGCQWILLINNDTEFCTDLFEQLVAGALKYDAAMVTPKMYFYKPADVIWCAGGDFLENRGWAARHIGIGEKDRGQYDADRPTDYAPTCCVLVRKDVYDKIGHMDATYFCYWDDTDFFFRAWRAGIRFYYLGKPTLYHKVSSLTGSSEGPFSLRYMTRNRVLYLRKHTSGLTLVKWLGFTQLQIFRDLLNGSYKFAGFMIKQRAFLEGLKLKIR